MKPVSFFVLLLSLFIFVSEADARGCRGCGGFRRGGPIRRWVQARRARRACRTCRPSRCSSGNCNGGGGSGGGSPTGPGGHEGGGAGASPSDSDSQSFGGLDPNASTQQEPPGAADTREEEPAAPSLPAENPSQGQKAEQPEEQQGDVCLEPLQKTAQALVATAAVNKEDAEAQSQARSFLETLELAKKSNPDFGQVDAPKRLYYFLEELTRKDPVRDSESPWFKEEGMYMPQNFQNLVRTLRGFPLASDRTEQLKALEESSDHLGWLTSRFVWPVRGSGFSDKRHFYDRAQSWLQCLKKTPEEPARDQAKAGEGQTPPTPPQAPPDQKKQAETKPEVDRAAVGQALYQSKCFSCHKGVKDFNYASERVGNGEMPPPDKAPALSADEITNLQAFFATQ